MLNRTPSKPHLVAAVCATLLGLGFASSSTSISAAAHAQGTEQAPAGLPATWKGSAGVVVSVVDERGGALPDAEVSLRFAEGAERLVLRTDENGRAEVTGIAGGEWQIDIQREGFMLFNAYVLLESGKKPKVAFSSRQRTGSYWEPLKAVFLPPGVQLGRGVASGRESVKQAQARAEKATKDSFRQQRRAERAANKGRLARVVPSEPVEPTITDLVERPEPRPEPAVAVAVADTADTADIEQTEQTEQIEQTEQSEQTEPTEQIADTAQTDLPEQTATQPAVREASGSTSPAVPPTQFPSPTEEITTSTASRRPEREPTLTAQAQKPAPSKTIAEPTQAVAAAPAVFPATPPPAAAEPEVLPAAIPVVLDVPLSPAPNVLRNPNLRPAGACPECGPGEYSVAARGQAEKFERGDTCSLARLAAVSALTPRLNAALTDGLGVFAGSLAESNGNDVLRLVPPSLRTDIRVALSDPSNSCQVVGVVLPAGSRYVGFRYQAGERSVMAECPQGDAGTEQVCQVGDARWLGPPSLVRTDGVTMVLGVFENRSRRSTRLPQLTVYFQPQRGWLPPSR